MTTDAEKLAAIEAAIRRVPGRRYVGTDELQNILMDTEPYRPHTRKETEKPWHSGNTTRRSPPQPDPPSSS